jgi:hypothetical protein
MMHRVQPDKIKKLLDNVASGSGMASVMEKVEGMKYLLAVCSPTSAQACACLLSAP